MLVVAKSKWKWLCMVAVLGFALTSCSNDAELEEPVKEPNAADVPAGPAGEDGSSTSPFNTEVVYFAFDSSVISSEGHRKLQELANFLTANTSVSLQIEGHCDERGTVNYNLSLGERRAQSVKEHIVGLGVAAERITTISYGEEKPAAQGHTEAAWSLNRRAEFRVANK